MLYLKDKTKTQPRQISAILSQLSNIKQRRNRNTQIAWNEHNWAHSKADPNGCLFVGHYSASTTLFSV